MNHLDDRQAEGLAEEARTATIQYTEYDSPPLCLSCGEPWNDGNCNCKEA